jgi:ribonuclease HII
MAMAHIKPDFERERMALQLGQGPVAGIDEAGRGPLAGPVVAAAVVLDPARLDLLDGLDDSKRLSEKARERLDKAIRGQALALCVAEASEEEIDRLNILQATFTAMQRALAGLSLRPALVLVDGNRTPGDDPRLKAVVGGDAKCLSIAAASVLAKVARDHQMVALAQRHPGYGFENHKGYGTPEHLAALRTLGPSPVHRRTFIVKSLSVLPGLRP